MVISLFIYHDTTFIVYGLSFNSFDLLTLSIKTNLVNNHYFLIKVKTKATFKLEKSMNFFLSFNNIISVLNQRLLSHLKEFSMGFSLSYIYGGFVNRERCRCWILSEEKVT